MFKDLEDQSFAIKLFRQSLMKGSEFRGTYQQTHEELGNRTHSQYGSYHHAGCTGRNHDVPDNFHQRNAE